MKTDDLIQMLAAGNAPVDRAAVQGRGVLALLAALLIAFAVMALQLGIRPDLAQAGHLPMFWIKQAFPMLLAAGGFIAALRLGRPGRGAGAAPALAAFPLIAMWLFALAVLFGAPAADRAPLVMGSSWNRCPVYIAEISLPLFIAMMFVMRRLAPTRPMLAGAAAGLAAGGAGAAVYALHCDEMAAPFLAVWYVLGMLIPTIVGALLGPKLLRW
jgi:hypothetical protein